MLPSLYQPSVLEPFRELAESAPVGKFIELGVAKGGTASILYEVAQTRNCELHLFERDNEFFDEVKSALPNAIAHAGVLPGTLEEARLTDVAFAWCDIDQPDITRAAMKLIWPRLVPGGILAFDYLFDPTPTPHSPFLKKVLLETFNIEDIVCPGGNMMFCYVRSKA